MQKEIPVLERDLSSEPGEMATLDMFHGKVISSGSGQYLVEIAPGRKEPISVDKATKIEQQPQEGDWVEVWMTENRIAKSIKKSKPAYTVEGNLLRIDVVIT
jgi:hypothetical protein